MKALKPRIERINDDLLVVRLSQIPVNWDREVISAVEPNITNLLIWQAVSQHPTPADKSGLEATDISLLNFDQGWGSQKAIDYAANKNLPVASPQQIFAIWQTYPRLHTKLGKPCLSVFCLQKYKLSGRERMPYLWFGPSKEKANFGKNDWFAVLGKVF